MVAKNTPSIPQNIDQNLKRAVEKLSETLDTGSGVRGSPDDRWLMVRDLVDLGLAKKLSKNAQALVSGANLVSTVAPILDIPPTPQDFEVVGGLGIVFLNWKNARQIYSNHAYTEIWRAEEDNLSNAVLIQQDASSFGSVDRNATYGATYYYWIRFVSLADIKGPYNSAAGTLGKLAEDPAILLEMLEGELTESQLHADLLERIDLIDGTGGLVDQAEQNAIDIINEANARFSLAQQLRGDYSGSSLSGVSTGLLRQEVVAREASINQLSSQMALLTAGSNTQFDTAIIWHFNTSLEGWSLGSIVGGFFRPNAGTNITPVVTFPAVSGSQYSQVRMRIRRVGNPTNWIGHFQYTTAGGTNSTSFGAPTFDADIAYLTRTGFGPWINDPGITSIGFCLYETITSTDYYEIDWIAIGRPSPGASSAELFTEQQARISADSALASDITIANAAIAGKASQASVDTINSRVTTAEGTLTTHGNKLIALDGQVGATSLLLNPNFAQWTNAGSYPDLWSAWDGTGLSQHTGIYAYSGGKAVQYSTNNSNNSGFRQDVTQNLDYLDFELVFTLTSGSLSGAGLHVQWLNTVGGVFTADIALKDLYVPSEIYNKKIVCKARIKRPTGYTGTFSNLRIYVMANYAGSSLGALSTKTIIFDTVFASVPDASAGAIQSLDTRMTSAEGSLTSQSSQLTLLRNNIALGTNALDISTWVAGSTGSQGVAGQQGYWANEALAGESRIVTAGNSGVAVGPFGGSELMWECQDSGDGVASGGYNVALAPYNKISKHRGCIFATFFRHNGLTNGSIYHGFDYAGGIVNMDGSPNSNPYSVAHGVGSFTADKWYLLYGVAHPRGSQIADTGLAGIYDCTTGEKILDCGEFRMTDAWDASTQIFRNYLYYSTDTSHKCWFARPLVTPLDAAPTPHQLMRYDSRTYANSLAISSLNSSVSTINGTVSTHSSQITTLQGDVAGKASSSALSALDARVTSTESINFSQASAITQISARIPGGGNLLPNSDFISNTNGWNFWNQGAGASTGERNLAGSSWTPLGYSQIGLTRAGAQTGVMHITSSRFPIEPNKKYCFSANIAGHRCTLRLIIGWFDASNTYITESQNGSWSQTGGNDLSGGQWTRRELFAIAPPNARYADVTLRGEDIGENDEYLWLCRPMLSEVSSDTTVAPPYTSSVSGAYAAISEEASVRAASDGTIMANKVLKLDVNGKVAGWGAMNTGVESIMEFAFDKVLFYSPGNTSLTLAVSDGKVVMDGAFIKTATIGSLQLGTGVVNDAHIANLNAVKLVAGSITTDKIEIGAVTAASSADFTSSSVSMATNSTHFLDVSLGNFVSTGAYPTFNAVVTITADSVGASVDRALAQVSFFYNGIATTASARSSVPVVVDGTRKAVCTLPIIFKVPFSQGGGSAGTKSLSIRARFYYFQSNGAPLSTSSTFSVFTNWEIQENKV